MNRKKLYYLLISTVCWVVVNPAYAQQLHPRVRQKLLEKAKWYDAPREYQITDDRPIVRDFRQPPESANTISLPLGPGANNEVTGGSGAGALSGASPGSTPTTAETHLGGPNQGFREAPLSQRTLPNAGFGGPNSNMASYKSPIKALPGGFTTGVIGKLMSQQKGINIGAKAPQQALKPSGHSAVAGPAVHSYGSNYGNGYAQSAASTEINVRGKLLRAKQ